MKVPRPPPTQDEIERHFAGTDASTTLALVMQSLNLPDEAYLHWDDLRHRNPPTGMDHTTWWLLLQRKRTATNVELPIDDHGHRFGVTNPDSVRRLVYTIDRDASGRIEIPEPVLTPTTRDQYVMAGLFEEAITSSQLEGASTTRRVAKEMLRTGRTPRDHDERMIWNNFQAMEWVRKHATSTITAERILELHRVVTNGTIDPPDGAGRLRRPDEPIVVEDSDTGDVLHTPPPATELSARLELLCRFAAGSIPDGFIHPVVRSTLLHFWLAFDHPFVDGNGRTARALFYWQMLREGYWLTEFVSISRILRKASAQYARSYLHCETTHDATYFVLHQLETLRRAIDDVFVYVKRKVGESRAVETKLRADATINHRQLALLTRALREPDAEFTIEGHQRSHGVVYQTARQDLLDLETRGWLLRRKIGRAFYFRPAPDLERKLGERPRAK